MLFTLNEGFLTKGDEVIALVDNSNAATTAIEGLLDPKITSGSLGSISSGERLGYIKSQLPDYTLLYPGGSVIRTKGVYEKKGRE